MSDTTCSFQVISLRLPTSLADDLRKSAAQSDRTLSAELRHAARLHLERQHSEEVSGSH
jgi:hypothetical protein